MANKLQNKALQPSNLEEKFMDTQRTLSMIWGTYALGTEL